ncbi:MAG: D-alanine-D-alanine ligase [Spirochaetes bacterium]|nr:MAG: D-alanine-D-alanine ligase [Spirochaetota bacterium]
MKNIAILFGGRSGEHEVSLISAASILASIDRGKYAPILVGIDRDGAWRLQEEPLSLGAREESGGLKSLPPVGEGQRILVAPGEGLYVQTASGIARPLPCDAVIPVLHGTFGEDGTIQGLLECANLPYVGSPVLGSAIGMDKHIAKELWIQNNLPVVDFIAVRAEDRRRPNFFPSLERKIEGRFGWPCFIKPAGNSSPPGK